MVATGPPTERPGWWARTHQHPPERTAHRDGHRISRLLPSRLDDAGFSATWRADVVAGITVTTLDDALRHARHHVITRAG